MTDPVALTKELIRCRSVTPEDDGALDLIARHLTQIGFTCHKLPFSEPGTAPVDNLFARIGTRAPHICFAGHSDVVPPGDASTWRHPPFAAEIVGDVLYGRGAVDMKGAVAAFVAAAGQCVGEAGDHLPGSVSLLITGDEEGPAVNGTVKVLDWMADKGHVPDHCVVGEPTNPTRLGEEIKIGRRGSLTGRLTVTGRQGHVAYPEKAVNPIPPMLDALEALVDEPLDHGSAHFQPSNLEITSVDVANPAENIIPERIHAVFNVRFNDHHDHESLAELIGRRIAPCLNAPGLAHELTFTGKSGAFVTEPGPLVDCLGAAVLDVTGQQPRLSTAGGTSDARFIKDLCPVVEFGLVNATIHQTDEHTAVRDLTDLAEIYRRFLAHYFTEFSGA